MRGDLETPLDVDREMTIFWSEVREPLMRIHWGPLWVGALAALAMGIVIGLVGSALGIQEFGPGQKITDWHKFGLVALIFSVAGAFFSFVVGGWVAGKLTGFRRAEPAMVHGAMVWLLALPLLLLLGAIGAGAMGGWYSGLTGAPIWTNPKVVTDQTALLAIRNGALAAVTAVLLGLIGAILGGWMASGEEMTPRLRARAERNLAA
jgi:MFS family permease